MTMLELRHVDAAYAGGAGSVPVLRNVSLRVEAGEMLALIGPNGAGKSTAVRVAAGVLRPSAGQARLDGTDLVALQPKQRAQRIAVVPQEGPLPSGLFVREMVALGRTPYARALLGPTAQDRRAVEWAISAAGIDVLADLMARAILPPTEIPVGILTAFVGGPFFLWLLRRERREYRL